MLLLFVQNLLVFDLDKDGSVDILIEGLRKATKNYVSFHSTCHAEYL